MSMAHDKGDCMISRIGFSTAKIVVGVLLAGAASVGYATAFLYAHPAIVAGGMVICFTLLTLPMWLELSGKPLRNVPAYYLLVLLVLVGMTLGRFPMDALLVR